MGAFVALETQLANPFMPLLTIAMSEVPRADAGLASGIVNTPLQVATAIGVAGARPTGTPAAEPG